MQTSDRHTIIPAKAQQPRTIPHSEHGLSLSVFDGSNVLKVLSGLKKAGYAAYLVGGCIRDTLLGLRPKDFDVATDAHPEQVRRLFKNCRLIGRRFRLAHVYFGKEIIEVSTFRASHKNAVGEEGRREEGGRITRDNVYGSLEDDVWRRDFTVNALYCDIDDFSIIDYVGGMDDLQQKRLRVIGVAEDRYREDPARILRAIRFSAKLDFSIHSESEQAIRKLVNLITDIPSARLFEEFLKLFMGGCSEQSYRSLRVYGLFTILFPKLDKLLNQDDSSQSMQELLLSAFRNTDQRLQQDKPVTPAFLLSVILWPQVSRLAEHHRGSGLSEMGAIHKAAVTVLMEQSSSTSMPKRFTHMMREIWYLQVRLQKTEGKYPLILLTHRRFRAAYDFLLLRAKLDHDLQMLADWWTDFQEQHQDILQKSKNERQKKHSHYARNRRR